MNKPLKVSLQLALTIGIIILGYFVFESIMKPIRFENNVENRSNEVVQKLKDIRTVELMYKGIYNKYTSNFDTLTAFIKDGEIPVVNIIQDPNDTTYTKTIADTVAYIKVYDSLFRDRKNFSFDHFRHIPYTDNKVFDLDVDTIRKGGVNILVIEVKTFYADFLKGLDEQLITNIIKKREDINKFPGLKFGSLKEPSTHGNWE